MADDCANEESGRDGTKWHRTLVSGVRVGSEGCTAGREDAPSCSRKGYKCPSNEESFEDVVRKRQQYISHVAEDENLPQEVEDFKELQIIKGFERIMREKVIPDGKRFSVCVTVCVCGGVKVKDSDHI